MKLGDYAAGYNRINNVVYRKKHILKIGDIVCTSIRPDIKKPYLTVTKGQFHGLTLDMLGINPMYAMIYQPIEPEPFHEDDEDEWNAPPANIEQIAYRLPMNPVFSKPLPLP